MNSTMETIPISIPYITPNAHFPYSEIALVLVTIVLAYFTFILAKEAKKTRELQETPFVVASIEPGQKYPHLFELVIENIGRGVALNIHVESDINFVVPLAKEKRYFNDYEFLKLEILKPGQSLTQPIGSFEELAELECKITAKFSDLHNKENSFSTSFNPLKYFGLMQTENPLKTLADQAKEISTTLKHVTKHNHRIKIDCFTEDDRKQQHSKMLKHYYENK